MSHKELVRLRRQAEQAVSDMPDGDLKLRAFEVILKKLLQGEGSAEDGGSDTSSAPVRERKKRQANRGAAPKSRTERILALKGERFFEKPTSIGEVRDGLAARGWHYPVTSLSGAMQELVQHRELRRQRMPEGKKRIWKYCNP